MVKQFCYKGVHSKYDLKKIVQVYRENKSVSETAKKLRIGYGYAYTLLVAFDELIPVRELAKHTWKKLTPVDQTSASGLLPLPIGILVEVGLNEKASLIGHWTEEGVFLVKERNKGERLKKGWVKLHKAGHSDTRTCYVPAAVVKSHVSNLHAKEGLIARWIPIEHGQLTLEIKRA